MLPDFGIDDSYVPGDDEPFMNERQLKFFVKTDLLTGKIASWQKHKER